MMDKLEHEQVKRAVVALKQFLKKQPKKVKQEQQYISAIITRQFVPQSSNPKPIQM